MTALLQGCRWLLLILFAASLTGCRGSRDKDENLITGLVTLDDTPLAGARLQFFPVEFGRDGPRALFGARTGADGRYQTIGIPGKYKVVVVKWVRKDGFTLEPKLDDPGQLEMQVKPDPNSPYRLAVPEECSRADKTPFTFDVTPGRQTIDLPLKSQPAPATKK